MKALLYVFIGGGFGSVCRYLLSKTIQTSQNGFPLGTFLANIIGCLIIGIILGLASKSNILSSNQVLLLATGFCGGFTTFSTFAFENNNFLKNGDLGLFALYAITSIVIGITAVTLGLFLSKSI